MKTTKRLKDVEKTIINNQRSVRYLNPLKSHTLSLSDLLDKIAKVEYNNIS